MTGRPLAALVRADSIVARLLALAALVAVAVLLGSAWLDTGTLTRTHLLLGGVLLFTLAWPADGLLLVAALTPMQVALARMFDLDPRVRLAEAIVLAFLAGWLARRVVSRDTRPVGLGRIGPPIWTCAAIIVASVAVSALTAPVPGHSWPDLQAAFQSAATRYLNADDFDPNWLRAAGLLLEGLLLVAAATALTASRPKLGRELVAVVAATAAASGALSLYSLYDVVTGALQTGEPVLRMLKASRTSFLSTDLNASGSYFAMALCVMLGAATASRGRTRSAWVGAAAVTAAALWLSGSRAAVGAMALVGLWHLARLARRRGWAPWTVGAAAAGLALGGAVAVWVLLPGRFDAQGQVFDPLGLVSIQTRWWFLTASWDMLKTAPWFGIGIGGYYMASENFLPGQLMAHLVPRENAHNNFAQIAVELGVAGLLAFLWLLVSIARAYGRSAVAEVRAWQAGAAAGLVAFLLTALTSHPLLVAPVAFAFWLLAAGLVSLHRSDASSEAPASATTGASVSKSGWVLVAAALAALAVSVPVRAAQVASKPGLAYGFGPVQVEPGSDVRFVWSEGRSRLVVSARPVGYGLWLRAPAFGPGSPPPVVEIAVDGTPVKRVRPPADRWELYEVVAPGSTAGGSWRVDLLVTPTWRDGSGREMGVMVRGSRSPQ